MKENEFEQVFFVELEVFTYKRDQITYSVMFCFFIILYCNIFITQVVCESCGLVQVMTSAMYSANKF